MTVITDTDIQSVALASSVTMSANQSCVKTALNASGSAPIYACRAWVNFDGTTGSGTGYSDITIRGSGNVTSITDNGTGDYTVNFTTAMPDANYSSVANAGLNDTSDSYLTCFPNASTGSPYFQAPTTSSMRFVVAGGFGSSNADDGGYINVAIFR